MVKRCENGYMRYWSTMESFGGNWKHLLSTVIVIHAIKWNKMKMKTDVTYVIDLYLCPYTWRN